MVEANTQGENTEPLSLGKINCQFPNEWIVIEVTKLDGTTPLAGKVLSHSPDDEEAARAIDSAPPDTQLAFFKTRPC